MKKKLEFMLAGSEVTRYHTVRTICQETVGHHSHGVALIAAFLSGGNPRAELLVAALVHDLAEHVLGDIPAPSKRAFAIGNQVSELEEKLLYGVDLKVDLSSEDARILKLADIAQGALFCIREIELGNSGMRVVYHRYKSYAEEKLLTGLERELFDLIQERYEEAGK